MALITKPDMEFIWASGGAIVEPSDVKKQTGWTPEVPPHQWENWIQNRQDNYLAHINQRGIPEWDGNTEYEASGLSYVQGTDGVIYKSVAASGPATTVQDPTTDVSDTYWEVAFNFINTVRVDVASAGTINLTTAAPNSRHINITGGGTINGFTVAAGQCYFARFDAAGVLANGSGLVTNRGANITVAAGDSCVIRATAANTVEILCGNFVADSAIGTRGQAWQAVTGSRVLGTVYTNTTGRTIKISVRFVSTAITTALATVNGVAIPGSSYPANGGVFVQAEIPAGGTYSVISDGGGTISNYSWVELRT